MHISHRYTHIWMRYIRISNQYTDSLMRCMDRSMRYINTLKRYTHISMQCMYRSLLDSEYSYDVCIDGYKLSVYRNYIPNIGTMFIKAELYLSSVDCYAACHGVTPLVISYTCLAAICMVLKFKHTCITYSGINRLASLAIKRVDQF
jgi:hypothetical protein